MTLSPSSAPSSSMLVSITLPLTLAQACGDRGGGRGDSTVVFTVADGRERNKNILKSKFKIVAQNSGIFLQKRKTHRFLYKLAYINGRYFHQLYIWGCMRYLIPTYLQVYIEGIKIQVYIEGIKIQNFFNKHLFSPFLFLKIFSFCIIKIFKIWCKWRG